MCCRTCQVTPPNGIRAKMPQTTIVPRVAGGYGRRGQVRVLDIQFDSPWRNIALTPMAARSPQARSPARVATGTAAGSARSSPPARRGSRSRRSRPSSSTTMRSACRTVDSRCAITIVVRPAISRAVACSTPRSVATSSALVGSSMIRIGASLSSARAIDSRWRWPPDKRDAALADDGIVLLRQLADELVGLRGAGRRLDLRARRRRPAVGDVLGDAHRQQERILRHQRDAVADAGERRLRAGPARRSARGPATDRTAAGTAPPACSCRRPTAPTSATVSPARMSRSMPCSTSVPRWYPKLDAFEPHVAADAARRRPPQRRRARILAHPVGRLEDLDDAARAARRRRDRRREVGEGQQRRIQRRQVAQEHDQCADRRRPREHLLPADQHDRGDAERLAALDADRGTAAASTACAGRPGSSGRRRP